MDAPSTILLLVGADTAWTPYADVGFTPEDVCVTTTETELDPLDEDFGTKDTTTCTTPEGWAYPAASPGSIFPAFAVGLGVERDRLRLTALFTIGPALAEAQPVYQAWIQPDLALGGQLVLEGVIVSEQFSFAAGGLGVLRGFGAHGEHDESGPARFSSSAQFGGGPALSLGWTEPHLLLRAYGVYTTGANLGAGVTLTWSPWQFGA